MNQLETETIIGFTNAPQKLLIRQAQITAISCQVIRLYANDKELTS